MVKEYGLNGDDFEDTFAEELFYNKISDSEKTNVRQYLENYDFGSAIDIVSRAMSDWDSYIRKIASEQ